MLKTEALKKTERIASAAYLLTGFFDDKEPLKWDIRNLSSRLVSKSAHLKDITMEARELVALFGVAKAAGLVSETNYEILSTETGKFIAEVEEMPKNLIVSRLFSPDNSLSAPETSPSIVKDKTSDSAQTASQSYQPSSQPARSAGLTVPAVYTPGTEERIKDKPLKEFGAVAVKKNTRQSVIINLLKRKKEIMIKDVSPLIEGVSEKTIQRELLSMVEQGIIKKEGEKRWSRYSLA